MRGDQTDAEAVLWSVLRNRGLEGLKFRRQVPVGNYVVDFICAEHRLIVEVDGSQHGDNTYDKRRDAELNDLGFTVLRFWNDDVLKTLSSVCDTIIATLREHGHRFE